MYIPLVREEEDCENLYTDDFFWLHERGVDFVIVFLFLHLLRKLYIHVYNFEQEVAWKSGAFLFVVMQAVIFFGLVLCCTHLSDITLTIAVNAFNTFCLFIGKLYWILFPDQTLNSDTVIRLAYLHYIVAILVAYFAIYHGIDMHYDWKTDAVHNAVPQELNWFEEVLLNEVGVFLNIMGLFLIAVIFLYSEPEALNYELFMWGDIGMVTDIRFFGVAPHWYFRPYMGWLVACPFHYIGLAGLISFFLIFYFQPNITQYLNTLNLESVKTLSLNVYNIIVNFTGLDLKFSDSIDYRGLFFKVTFSLFLISVWYTFSYLPYGRFFNRLGGNEVSLYVYSYLYLYLGTLIFRYAATYWAAVKVL